jgi:hypothetical protein
MSVCISVLCWIFCPGNRRPCEEHRIPPLQPGRHSSYPRHIGGERKGAARRPRIAAATRFSTKLPAAIADPPHREHADIKEWAGEYDPTTVDTLSDQYALDRIAKSSQRRQGASRQKNLRRMTVANKLAAALTGKLSKYWCLFL